ncbi:MAG: YbhB/YbcL family Raf kinase inhibitor-like protein, partial [bacterium]
MNLTSPAFENGQLIPQKYGAAFENVSPSLSIADVPAEAKSLVLVMDDPDVPTAARVPVWDHWVLFDLPPETRELPEGRSPDVGVRGKGTGG